MILKRIFFLLGNLKLTRTILSFYWTGYLAEIGWFKAFQQQMPVGRNNEPIPWVTYSFIQFIEKRLNKDLIILEYGSGNSTLFYSKHVKKVLAVEHEMSWVEKIIQTVPPNVELKHIPLDTNGAYSKFAASSKEPIDIIIVDGRDRVNCLKNSFDKITSRGVIVLDDSEREEYSGGVEYLQERGFKKIDFWGIAPGVFYNKCTTLFYRPENCLNV
jgi:hypothetical protein